MIRPLGPGYTIHRVQSRIAFQLGCSILSGITQHEPGRPEQYCIVLDGLNGGGGRTFVSVAPFPVAWRLEPAREERYRGLEYVR